ncbi:MAG: hypothetical protein ACLVJ6_10520 [Merdibacter sp.]
MQDKSGTMDAKYWNVPESALELYQAGMIVDASGDVLSHNHQLQFRIKQLDIVEETVEARSFAQEGPLPVEVLRERIEACLENIQNENLKRLIDAVYEKYRSDFYEYPAATKNHHDFVGGLATHVLGMLDLAEMLAAQYPILNRDLLVSRCVPARSGQAAGAERRRSFPAIRWKGVCLAHLCFRQRLPRSPHRWALRTVRK